MFKLDIHLQEHQGIRNQSCSFTEHEKHNSEKKKLEFLKIDFNKKSDVENEKNQLQIIKYLRSIRVCRTDYQIKGNKVFQITERKHTEHNLFSFLSKMHDGQIFEYVQQKKFEVEHPVKNHIQDEKEISESDNEVDEKAPGDAAVASPEGLELISLQNQSMAHEKSERFEEANKNFHEILEHRK